MRNRIREFFNLEGSLWRYVVGTTLLANMAQIAYDFSKEWDSLWSPLLLLLALLLLFGATLGWHVWSERRFQNFKPSRFRKSPRRAGLILLVNPGEHWLDAAKVAFDHHGQSLRAVWLIHCSFGILMHLQNRNKPTLSGQDAIHLCQCSESALCAKKLPQ